MINMEKKSLVLIAGITVFIMILLLSGFFVRKLTPVLEEAYYLESQVQLNKFYTETDF